MTVGKHLKGIQSHVFVSDEQTNGSDDEALT